MELLPFLIVCLINAVQIVYVWHLQRKLLAAEAQTVHYQQLFSDTVHREMAVRESMLMERRARESAPPARPDPPIGDSAWSQQEAECHTRSEALLKSWLSPEQIGDYERTHSFVVVGGITGKSYRICWGYSQNIIRLDADGHPDMRLCFGPRGVPIGDILLAQKIALEAAELAALRIAGKTPVPPRYISPDAYAHTSRNSAYAPHPSQIGQRLEVRMPPDYDGQLDGDFGHRPT